ncbi:MAG: DUF4351 domain-containing protein [Dolichospermum sp. DEX182a]|jgi:hypothetical protein|nr:DUF4351 domain-containing protein [Dolichospermum sp. DEX182a]
MTVEEAIALVEELLKREYLTKVQEIVLRQSWIGKTYLDIAVEYDYDLGYIKDVGSELWRSLSQVLGEKVTKNNINRVLTQTVQQQNDEKQNIKCTKILAELTFEKDVIIIQVLGEYLIEESIIYQNILQKGEKQQSVKWMIMFLKYRFSEVNLSLIEEIKILPLQTLELLRDAIFEFSTLADLELWLKQQQD